MARLFVAVLSLSLCACAVAAQEAKPRLTTACVIAVAETDDPRCTDKLIEAARPGWCRTDSRAWARVTASPEGCALPSEASWTASDPHVYVNGWHRRVAGVPATDCGTDGWGGTLWCQSVGWLAAPAGDHDVCAHLGDVEVCTVLTTYGAPVVR